MRALLYDEFGAPPRTAQIPEPEVAADGILVEVKASGICRSDWHGWMGHDADIKVLPHVPGHEFAGVVVETGRDVTGWHKGDRVTTPFVLGCGRCEYCLAGDPQVCPDQYQPGFTGPGSFAEYVALPYADVNVVRLPDELDFVEAATLGCRFVTAFRGIVTLAKLQPAEWLVTYGCGGVGLSAILIARALDARVIAVDVDNSKLARARELGAEHALNARTTHDVPAAILELTRGGAHVSVDAYGSAETSRNAIHSLRRRGRHVQLGLLVGADADPRLPMGKVIGRELAIYGGHGMQAHAYAPLLGLILSGKIALSRLIGRRITLEEAGPVLAMMAGSPEVGVAVIDRFRRDRPNY